MSKGSHHTYRFFLMSMAFSGLVGWMMIPLNCTAQVRGTARATHLRSSSAPVGAWTSGGPSGGSVLALAIDPVDSDDLYAGTVAGLFKSTDGGASWFASNLGPGGISINAIAIYPGNPDIVYGGGNGANVFKSADRGMSWSGVSYGLAGDVRALAIDPFNQNTLYAGTYRGLYTSTDGGGSWIYVMTAPAGHSDPIFYLAIDPRSANTLYRIGCNEGDDQCDAGPALSKSTDGGRNWTPSISHFRNLYPDLVPICVAIDPNDSKVLYVGTARFGVYKSMDGGASWSESNTGLRNLSVMAIVIDPVNTSTLYAGTFSEGVFKTTDGGATWSEFNTGLTNLNVRALAIDSLGRFLHAGTAEGVFDYELSARPTLMLDRSAYCIGESWKLNIVNAPPGAAIQLAGALDGNPWSLPDWGITDQDGSYSGSGTYVDGNQGTYQLYASIGGITTNTIFVTVSDCTKPGVKPTLTLDRSEYCIRDSWKLGILDAPAGAEIRLAGVLDGNSWSLPDWGITDQNGRYSANGTYVDGNQGNYQVYAEIGGITTNTIFVTVSDCKKQQPQGFTFTGSMSTPRSRHTATLLADGRVLVVGGGDGSAELFDPATETFSPTGSPIARRSGHAAVLLPDGKVLIAGGYSYTEGTVPAFVLLNSAEIYDPSTGTFSQTGSMARVHGMPTATLLANGKVLIAGGLDDGPGVGGHSGAGAELFDSTTGSFAMVGNMISARTDHTATLLSSGEVLIVGGWNGDGADAGDDPPFDPVFGECFNPSSGNFIAVGEMSSSRSGHTATLLPNGKVAVIGGFTWPENTLETIEIYDPVSQTFSSSGNAVEPRSGHSATLLDDGKVLIAGGADPYLDVFSDGIFIPHMLPSAGLFDPASGALTVTAGLQTARQGHTATLLKNGAVLITGGTDSTGAALPTAEIYR